TPPTKNKFHTSFFQSYLKKEIFDGIQIAHTCLSDEEIPNVLLPRISNRGTVRPISGPDTYQGQGCLISSSMGIGLMIYFDFFISSLRARIGG
ncbi:MAG: hypothetical protein RL316_1526, partial [Bacteroidota bacterium]